MEEAMIYLKMILWIQIRQNQACAKMTQVYSCHNSCLMLLAIVNKLILDYHCGFQRKYFEIFFICQSFKGENL